MNVLFWHGDDSTGCFSSEAICTRCSSHSMPASRLRSVLLRRDGQALSRDSCVPQFVGRVSSWSTSSSAMVKHPATSMMSSAKQLRKQSRYAKPSTFKRLNPRPGSRGNSSGPCLYYDVKLYFSTGLTPQTTLGRFRGLERARGGRGVIELRIH